MILEPLQADYSAPSPEEKYSDVSACVYMYILNILENNGGKCRWSLSAKLFMIGTNGLIRHSTVWKKLKDFYYEYMLLIIKINNILQNLMGLNWLRYIYLSLHLKMLVTTKTFRRNERTRKKLKNLHMV